MAVPAGTPGRRNRERVRRNEVCAAAVTADGVERPAREIRHPAAGRHGALERPAREGDGAGCGHPPAHLTVGDAHRDERGARGEHGIARVRREVAIAGGAQGAYPAVRVDGRGDPAPEHEHHAVLHLHAERRALLARRASGVQIAGDRDGSCGEQRRQHRPDDPRKPGAPPPHGGALGEGREHEAAPALAGLDLARCLEALEAGLQRVLAGVHELHLARELVECAAQARVDRSAREVEHLGDLARGVLQQVAQDDHGARIGCEPPDGLGQVVGEIAARLGRDGLVRRFAGRRNAWARAQSSARLVTMRCSQGANGRARSNRSSTRMACRNASWAMSSAACASRVTR